MIPAAWGFAVQILSKMDFKGVLRFLGRNWKETILIACAVWIGVCLQWHCSSKKYPTDLEVRTLVQVDTLWVPADTNMILKLKGYDTIPKSISQNTTGTWRPPKISIDSNTSSDSIALLIKFADLLERSLIECDSAFASATAIREYDSEVKNDSVAVRVGLQVKGTLLKEPDISYRWLAPIPVVEKHFEKILPPKRRFGLGAAVGPYFQLPTDIAGVDASLKLHYLDRKHQIFTLEPGIVTMQESGWYFKIGYSRFF